MDNILIMKSIIIGANFTSRISSLLIDIRMVLEQNEYEIGSVMRNSEYDQEIPQSQTADKPMASRGRATQQSRDTRKTNQAKQPTRSSTS